MRFVMNIMQFDATLISYLFITANSNNMADARSDTSFWNDEREYFFEKWTSLLFSYNM
jgi:hypothetical protein